MFQIKPKVNVEIGQLVHVSFLDGTTVEGRVTHKETNAFKVSGFKDWIWHINIKKVDPLE